MPNSSEHKELRVLDLPHGAYSRIARRLRPKVTPQHVREVALGKRQSARVERAIQTYLKSLPQERAA
jgi:hypothetical protein